MKKALELSILCKCDIAVVILPAGNKTLHQWTNLATMDDALAKYKTIKEASGVRVQVEASATPLCYYSVGGWTAPSLSVCLTLLQTPEQRSPAATACCDDQSGDSEDEQASARPQRQVSTRLEEGLAQAARNIAFTLPRFAAEDQLWGLVAWRREALQGHRIARRQPIASLCRKVHPGAVAEVC